MATFTPNYNLIKPEYNDWADIEVLNGNTNIIDGVLKELETKLVPPIGSILMFKTSTNPGELYLGTTWTKIEGKMLRATTSGQTAGTTGGADSLTLTEQNLPPHSHIATQLEHTHTANHSHTGSQEAHTHSRGSMDITGSFAIHGTIGVIRMDESGSASGAFYEGSRKASSVYATETDGADAMFQASRKWTGSTSSSQPAVTINSQTVVTNSVTPSIDISSTGNGDSFSVLNAYYSVNVWERIA